MIERKKRDMMTMTSASAFKMANVVGGIFLLFLLLAEKWRRDICLL